METSSNACAHDRCKCPIEPAMAVSHDGKTFCSERCADNRGCDHHGCNCGVFPTEGVEKDRTVARQSAT